MPKIIAMQKKAEKQIRTKSEINEFEKNKIVMCSLLLIIGNRNTQKQK